MIDASQGDGRLFRSNGENGRFGRRAGRDGVVASHVVNRTSGGERNKPTETGALSRRPAGWAESRLAHGSYRTYRTHGPTEAVLGPRAESSLRRLDTIFIMMIKMEGRNGGRRQPLHDRSA